MARRIGFLVSTPRLGEQASRPTGQVRDEKVEERVIQVEGSPELYMQREQILRNIIRLIRQYCEGQPVVFTGFGGMRTWRFILYLIQYRVGEHGLVDVIQKHFRDAGKVPPTRAAITTQAGLTRAHLAELLASQKKALEEWRVLFDRMNSTELPPRTDLLQDPGLQEAEDNDGFGLSGLDDNDWNQKDQNNPGDVEDD
jgi:hypothetical protein